MLNARPTQRGRGKILEFDILRATAILLLILHHGGIYNFSVAGFPLANLSRYIQLYLLGSFIFLSGYLTVSSVEKRSLKEFLASRITRIYIPYLFALGLFLTLLELEVDQLDIAIHLFGAQMVLSPRLTTPILTLWFVGLILVYYALFGLLLKAFRKNSHLLVAIGLIFGAAVLLRMDHSLFARRFFYYYFIYAGGVLLARTNLLNKLTTTRFYLLDKVGFAALGVVLITPVILQTGEEVNLLLILAITVYVLAMVLLSLSAAKTLVQSERSLKAFTMISSASFFAYLFHRPIWQIGMAIYRPESIHHLSIYLILIGFLVVIPVSYGLQKAYDSAIHSLEMWREQSRRGAARSA